MSSKYFFRECPEHVFISMSMFNQLRNPYEQKSKERLKRKHWELSMICEIVHQKRLKDSFLKVIEPL